MHTPVSLRLVSLLAALLLGACAPAVSAPSGPSPAAPLADVYAQAVANAAVYEPGNVFALFPIVPDAQGNVRVVTLTTWNYAPGEQPLGRDIWVTAVPEVRDSCAGWTDDDLKMRLRQLLGLRPADSVSHFVEMTVPVAAMFRPTVDPAVTTLHPCPADQVGSGSCGLQFPPSVQPAHVEWMARQMLSSWKLPDGYPASAGGGGADGTLGYPWTRLGYTYNWHPGSPRYGASEYLVRGGTQIRVDRTTPVAAYCGRA
jgi:hypothetical protein